MKREEDGLVVSDDAPGFCDEWVGVVPDMDDGAAGGVVVGVPGILWGDRYVVVGGREAGVAMHDDDGDERDYIGVRLSADGARELIGLIERALAVLAERDDPPAWHERVQADYLGASPT